MGKRGPPPEPTALKKLKGNPGKRPLNENEPKPSEPVKAKSPYDYLLPEAKKEWKTLAPILIRMGVLTEVDWEAFGAMCQNYAMYLNIDAEYRKSVVDRGQLLVKTPTGYVMKNPIINARSQAYDLWRRSMGDFGLTPTSRQRLVVTQGAFTASQTGETVSPMMSLIANAKR